MKRLVGGDYLLDLSSIELEESEDGSTKTNITDSDVLEQLINLKKYINNPEMAKPVWVKLKNGENDELVIARGTFAFIDTGEFEICVQLDGYKLVIFIEFTQVLNSDDEPLDDWYIDTNDAKYLFTSDAQALAQQLADFTGDVNITGDASVTGDVTVKTLEQSQANWKGDNINFGAPSGLTITNTYNRLEIINQVLHCIVNFKIENNSGESKTFSGVDLATTIPEKYAEKIIDVNGDSVKDTIVGSHVFITAEPCMAQKNSSSYDGTKYSALLLLTNRGGNYISVFVDMESPLSLSDGDYIYVTGRIALTLL